MVWVRYAALAANAGLLVFLGVGFVLEGASVNQTGAWLSFIGQAFIPALSLIAIWLGKMPEVRKFKPRMPKRNRQTNVVSERSTKQERKDAEYRSKLLQNYKSRLTAYSD